MLDSRRNGSWRRGRFWRRKREWTLLPTSLCAGISGGRWIRWIGLRELLTRKVRGRGLGLGSAWSMLRDLEFLLGWVVVVGFDLRGAWVAWVGRYVICIERWRHRGFAFWLAESGFGRGLFGDGMVWTKAACDERMAQREILIYGDIDSYPNRALQK